MKNLKKSLTGVLCLSIGLFSFVSCMKDEPQQNQAMGDVIIRDMKTDTGVKYGLQVYVAANFEIHSGKVTDPNGKVYQLSPTSDKFQFIYTMPEAEYASTMPVKGDYAIEVTSLTGETLYGKDAIGEEKLTPIVIKSTSFSSGQLKVSWDKVTDADAYIVRLYTENKKELIYSSSYISSTLTEFQLGSGSLGWATGVSPSANTNYVVEISAVLVESNVISDQGNNIQFITVDSKAVKWE